MKPLLLFERRFLFLSVVTLSIFAVPVFGQIAVPGVRIRPALWVPHDQDGVYRVHGKVTAVDQAGRIVTVGNKGNAKEMAIVMNTVLIKDGAEVKLSRVSVGDDVDGVAGTLYGKFTAISVRFGPYHKDLPYGKPVKDHPGCVISPYSLHAGYVNVVGIPAGMEAKDPYSDKIFLVP
jgi:hypothetical protein